MSGVRLRLRARTLASEQLLNLTVAVVLPCSLVALKNSWSGTEMRELGLFEFDRQFVTSAPEKPPTPPPIPHLIAYHNPAR